MKTIIKIFATFAAVIFAMIAVIKFVQGCSWKEAVGIAEEFCNEMRGNCPLCYHKFADEDAAPEEA